MMDAGALPCYRRANGSVAERSKAHAWKVCRGLKLLQGSNPCRSAICHFLPFTNVQKTLFP